MDLQMTAVLAHAYVGTVGTGLAVDDAVGNLGLLWRWHVLFEISGIKPEKDILNGWFTHLSPQLSCQKDSEFQSKSYYSHGDRFLWT